MSQCKECHKEYRRQYHQVHRKRENVYTRQYYQKNKRRWLKHDLKKFGLTLGQYDILFESQGGRCAICQRRQSEFKIRLAVDHDHATGRVRGLLCADCNRVLGMMEDSTDRLQNAVDYLEAQR